HPSSLRRIDTGLDGNGPLGSGRRRGRKLPRWQPLATRGGEPTPGTEGRRSVNAHSTSFLTYDLEGPIQPELRWLPVSYDRTTGEGTYLMRMEPGAVTIEHEHAVVEEFLVLEGDLVDSDGAV